MSAGALLAAGPSSTRKQPSPNETASSEELVDFVAASYEHTEMIINETLNVNTSGIRRPINAYGFLRSILLYVSATVPSANSAAVAIKADGPWSAIASVAVQDVSGANIYGPVSGYDTYLINRYGGYDNLSDPVSMPFYSAPVTGTGATGGNFAFALRIPVEASGRTGFCSLANRSNSARFNLLISTAATTAIYSTAPTAPPTGLAVVAIGEYWSDPGTTDPFGRPVQPAPQYNGSTQYWSKDTIAMTAGSQKNFALNRVGNLIRNLIFVNRDSSGDRTAAYPTAARITWDGRVVHDTTVNYFKDLMARKWGYLGSTLETGVLAIPFTHDLDGKPGYELMKLYVPTAEGTRYEIVYDSGAAGSVDVLVNDIALLGGAK